MANIPLNISNQRFGRLIAIKDIGSNKDKKRLWLCICDCGNQKITTAKSLKAGLCKSCGCLPLENVGKFSHGQRYTKFYRIWVQIKRRCNNKNAHDYKYYGGRGIVHDPKWNDFKNFKKDMFFKWCYAKHKYHDENVLSIERRNVNGNYCFENCEFIPINEQWKNRRISKKR